LREINRPDREATILEIEQNLCEMWSTFGRGPGCALHDEKDALWFETPIPIIPYNGVLRFRVQDRINERIDEIIGYFNERGMPFMWNLHPNSFPPDLPDRLKKRGLKDVEPIYGMARTLSGLPDIPPLPAGFEIRKVADESDASAFYQFAAWRWHIPKEYTETYAAIAAGFQLGKPRSRGHMWQIWHEGHPVSKAGMYLGSGSAGIYAVVTLPEARRLGLAGILTITAIHEARRAGCNLAVLHSTPMAQNLYQSLGFATFAEFRLFASQDVQV
jgi:ribosomal protein S18 acetylase RimI-like enzyme